MLNSDVFWHIQIDDSRRGVVCLVCHKLGDGPMVRLLTEEPSVPATYLCERCASIVGSRANTIRNRRWHDER